MVQILQLQSQLNSIFNQFYLIGSIVKKSVYIETTIPSFYYDVRIEAEMVSKQTSTRLWWEQVRPQFKVLTSLAVYDELSNGDFPFKKDALSLLETIEICHITKNIIEIMQTYIAHKAMPGNPIGDALHVAIASFYKCDFLLTWNCKHIANPNKFDHIIKTNSLMGLTTPNLITPLDFVEEFYENKRCNQPCA
jgi:hypothetical protein